MSWLKEQNRLTHEFCRGELSHFLHITACAFAALAVIGLVLGLVRPDLCSWMIGQFVQQMEDMGIQQADGHLSALMLLGNNLRASIACILYGFVPFLFLPALSLGVNAGLLGLLAAFYLQNDISLWYYLAGILPHGIFELPALVNALALGVSLCSHVTDFVRHNQKGVMVPLMLQMLRVLLLRVLPLLIVAAVMEAYVTPLVLALLGQ